MNLLNDDIFKKILEIIKKDTNYTILNYICENNLLLKQNIIFKIKLHYYEIFGKYIIYNAIYIDLLNWLNYYNDTYNVITLKLKEVLTRCNIYIDDFLYRNIDLRDLCVSVLDSLSINELNEFYEGILLLD
jgi:hypothetical protein